MVRICNTQIVAFQKHLIKNFDVEQVALLIVVVKLLLDQRQSFGSEILKYHNTNSFQLTTLIFSLKEFKPPSRYVTLYQNFNESNMKSVIYRCSFA